MCVCVCVPVGGGANLCLVWQRRFRRHDDEPRKPSRTLTPPLTLSLAVLFPFALLSPSLSYVCVYYCPSSAAPTILWPVHRNILSLTHFTNIHVFSFSLSTLQLRQFLPPACGFYARFRARVFALHTSITCTPRMYICATLQTAARFIHLLGSVPGCCTLPSPSARVVAPGPTLCAIPEPARARGLRGGGGGGGGERGLEYDFEYEKIGSAKVTKCNKNASFRVDSVSPWSTPINSTHPPQRIYIDGFYVRPCERYMSSEMPGRANFNTFANPLPPFFVRAQMRWKKYDPHRGMCPISIVLFSLS